jgi:hypothetical protein
LNLQALKFDFCAFCAFLRLYQKSVDFFGIAHILQNGFGRRVFGFRILFAAVYGPKKYVDKN